MLIFGDCFLIAVGAVHEASMVYAVSHGKSVTQFVVYHLY